MRIVLGFIFVLSFSAAMAQEFVTTVGFQVKPMVDTRFIDSGGGEIENSWLRSDYTTSGGYAMGMVIRQGLTETISIETGISYLKRNYKVSMLDVDSLYSGSTEFSLINYQIPLQGLIYARLSDKLWMNASGGFGINFFPSNAQSSDFDATNGSRFGQVSYRTGFVQWLKLSILANYGFEYRTEKDGYFYLGLSFDRPFNNIIASTAFLERPNGSELTTDGIYTGSYLTIDFRYFFHESPDKKKRKPNK